MQLPKEAVVECRVQWGPLPDWKALTTQTKGGKGDKKEHTKLHLKPDRAAPLGTCLFAAELFVK